MAKPNTVIVQQGEQHRVTLKKKKRNLVALPFRIVGFVFGLLYFLIALVLCFTIVGLIIGIPMAIGATGVMVMAINPSKQKVVCPSCNGKRNFVANGAESFVCTRCRNVVLVDWHE